MPISCFCSQCGARIRAPEKAAGRKVKCPKCHAEFMVPVSQPNDSPKAARSALEDLAREKDAPQALHWSVAPPVRREAISEIQESPTATRSNLEGLGREADESQDGSTEPQLPPIRLSAVSEVEEPSPAPNKPPAWRVAVGCGLCLALLASCAGLIFKVSEAVEMQRWIVDDSKAITIARHFINARLKWDDEADFGSLWDGTDDTKAWREGNVWIVQGHAKAKNGFGVKGRFFFQVRMVKPNSRADWTDPGNWSVLDIEIVD